MLALTPHNRMTRPKTAKHIADLNFLRFHTAWAGKSRLTDATTINNPLNYSTKTCFCRATNSLIPASAISTN